MNSMNVLQVPKEFLEKFPKVSAKKANKLYNRYLKSIRIHLIKLLPFTKDRIVEFPKHKAQIMSGSFRVNKIRYSVWNEFYNLQPFFYDIDTGSQYKKRNTRIYMNQKLIDMLIDTGDTNELINEFYGSCDPDILHPVKIDIKSLTSFIDHTTEELKHVNNDKHEDKLRRNLRCAKYIKLISTFFVDAYGDYVLPHIPSPSPYGRNYYKGINLQNVSKEVRAAALGNHHVYDLNAAVYAIKLYLACDLLHDKGIDHYGKFTYTKEYLDSKSNIRLQLAKHIVAYPDPIKLVKEAITAIGFGAKIGGSAYPIDDKFVLPALNDIIKNKDDRNRFINDPWIIAFTKEQRELTRFIVDEYKKIPAFINKISNIPNIKNKNGILQQTKVMSYLFQTSESMIMNYITQNIKYDLLIHDAIITKKPIPNHELLDMKSILQGVNNYFSLSHEFVNGWESYYAIVEEINHKQRIKQETKLAESKGYKMSTPVINQLIEKINTPNDHKPYYDYQSVNYNDYDNSLDEEVRFMTPEEKSEHYRILGIQQIPKFIQEIL